MADWRYTYGYRGRPPATRPVMPPPQQQRPSSFDWSKWWKSLWVQPAAPRPGAAPPPSTRDADIRRSQIYTLPNEQRLAQTYQQNKMYVPPPPGRPFAQAPDPWESKAFRYVYPGQQQWKPDYDPTYWENPLNIAKAYMQYKAAKPGDVIPEWYDPESFEQAYKYMAKRNGGAPWYEWKYLHPDDPGRQFLQQIQQPSMDYALPKTDYDRWLTAKLMQEDPQQWDFQELQSLPKEVRNALMEQKRVAALQTPFEDLPMWQKINLRAMSSPALQGALTMAPFAVAGGVAGATGGPVGIALGAGVPLALGAGLGALSAKSQTAANLLMKLDYPAEWFEQATGVGLQAAASLTNPDVYGSIEEVVNNLPAAWEASHATDTTGSYLSFGEEAPLNFLYPALGLDKKERGRFDVTNILPAINYAIAAMAGNEEEMRRVQFAGPDEVFYPATADPQKLDATGLVALVNLRREIVNGADPIEALNRTYQDFGLSGQFTEMAAHVILDPLNVLPTASAKGIGIAANIAGNVPMAKAFADSVGPVQGWKKYRTTIRTGGAGAADELGALAKFVGGLTAEGKIKALEPEASITNPFRRWLAHTMDLTPAARGRLFVSHIADNIGVLLDMRKGDPDGQVALIKQLVDKHPRAMAEISGFLGNPELYTGKQAIATALPTIQTALELYHSADAPRALLNKIIDVLGDPEKTIGQNGSEILKQLRTAEGADTLFTQLNSTLDQLDPALAGELRSDPGWNAEGFKGMLDAFTGDNPIPWHPDEFAAHTWGITNEATAKWSEAAYGIKPDSGFYRFFDTLKRAQSFVLLGFNPNYLVGNEIGNVVGRAATGVWGYAARGTIDNFIRRFGVEPYRFEAGVGASGILPEQRLKGEKSESAVGEPVGRVGNTGEEVIRKAQIEQRGLLAKARGKIDTVSRAGVVSQMSRSMEVAESVQTWYQALKKADNWLWNRKNMIPQMPPELVDFLRQNGVDANKVYSMLEGSLNNEEIAAKINGEVPRYDIDDAIGRVSQDQGVDVAMAKDTLDDVYFDLKDKLDKAKTPDEVRAAFASVEELVQDHFDELVRENLRTRAEQIQQTAMSGGFAEAIRLWEEMHFNTQEYWIRHFDEWEHTFALADALRDQNVPIDTINRLFAMRKKDARRQWKRVRSFEKTTSKAILEGLGTDDANVRRYVNLLEQTGSRWDEYYKLKESEIDKLIKASKDGKFATPAERIAAWAAMEEAMNAEYIKAAGDTAGRYKEIDELFITIATDQFGEGVGSTARWWRENIQNLRQSGTDMISEFRNTLVGMDGATRRGAWEQFLNETYRPYIYEFFTQLDDGAMEVYKSANGNPPPDGAPPANPLPLPPEPQNPLPGEPRGAPVVDAELLAAQDRLDSYLNLHKEDVSGIASVVDDAIQTGELRVELEGDTPTPNELARWQAMKDYARTQGYELSEPEVIRPAEAPEAAPAPTTPPPAAPPAPPAAAQPPAPEPERVMTPETVQRLTDYGLTPDEIEAVRTGAMTPDQMEEVIARVTQPAAAPPEGPGVNVPGRGVIGGAAQPTPARVPGTPGEGARTPVAPGDEGVPEYLRTIVRPNLEYDITNPKVKEILREEVGQQTDLRRIFSNYKRGNRAYLLANGTGTGKTYIGMGVIAESGAKNVLVVMPSRNIFGEWEGAAKLFGIPLSTEKTGPGNYGGVYLTTYASVGKDPRKFLGKKFDLIIADESHRMKGEGQWGSGIAAVIDDNPNAKLLFQSATPFQSAGQMEYLKYLGLWDANDRFGFDNFLQDHHYTYVTPSVGPGYWRFDGNISDILDIYRKINERGLGSTRNLVIDQNLDNRFVRVPLDPYHSNLYNQANSAFNSAAAERGLSGVQIAFIKAQKTIALRRILEMSKIDDTIRLAKQQLADGRQVAVFTGFKGDLKPPHFNAPNMRGVNAILEAFYSQINAEEGRTIQRLVNELGGPDVVAVITGDVSDKMKKLEINNYQTGRRKVLVATAASGGTGLSLHDTKGGAPRAQINMYLPWSGQDFQQVAGRSYRYGSKSNVVQYWLFGDAPKEMQIAQTVGGRLREMGGLVSGVTEDLDANKIQAFDFGLLEDDRIAGQVLNQPVRQAVGTTEGVATPPTVGGIEFPGIKYTDVESFNTFKAWIRKNMPGTYKNTELEAAWRRAQDEQARASGLVPIKEPEIPPAPAAPRFAPEEVRAAIEGARPAEASAIVPDMSEMSAKYPRVPKAVTNDIVRGKEVFAPKPGVPEEVHRLIVHDAAYALAEEFNSPRSDPKIIKALTDGWLNAKNGIFDDLQQQRIDAFVAYSPAAAPPAPAPAPQTAPGVVAAPTRRTTALGPDPTETFNLDFEIYDLDDLVTSHSDLGEVNPDFPKELQPRGRDRLAAMQQVNKIAAELNPDAYIQDTHRIDSGTPIIDAAGRVLSGNGRTIALRIARDLYPENYARYVEAVKAQLAQYGIPPAELETVKNPVLIRRVQGDINPVDFAAKANQSGTLRMSPFEVALQDAGKVRDDLLASLEVGETQSIDQALNSTPNRPLVRSFLDGIPENERAALLDAQGNLNRSGLERIKYAVFAKTYPGEAGQRILTAFSESIDPGIKNFENALYASLPDMAKSEGAIRSGQRAADLSLATDIARTVDVYARLKAQGASVTDYLSQLPMLGAELDDFQRVLLGYISENSRSPKRLRDMLQGYSRAVMDQAPPQQMSMFGGVRATKAELLQNVLTTLTPEGTPLLPEQQPVAIPGGAAPEITPIIPGGEELAGAIPGGAGGGAEIVGRISPAVQPEAPRPAAPPRTSLDDVTALARQYGIATASETGVPIQTVRSIVNKFLRGEYGEPKDANGKVYEKQTYRDVLDAPLETIQDALDARQRFQELSQGSGNAVGPFPPGVIDNLGYPEYRGMTEAFAWEQRARPLLEGIEEGLLSQVPTGRSGNIGGMDMPPPVRGAYNRWMNDVKGARSSSKLAAIRWAENLRDQALINYSKTRGVDNMLNVLFPYQYWYTRSMWQWAQRMIDRPKWFANYARLRNYQRNLTAIPGFPSRLRDKMAIPAPYLPDWAGGEAWIDPLRQAFYPEQFMSPIDKMARDQSEVEQRASYVLQKWVQEGKTTRDAARQALVDRSGYTWNLAMADATRSLQGEQQGSNLDFLGLMLGPALYLTLPGYLATGKDIVTGRDDISLLPMTRTGRTLKEITKNTPLHAIGQAVGGIMSYPEEALRRKRGLSEFGDWGNYYVDRMLSSMAAEGNYTTKQIVQAMIERNGNPIYDEATERVRLETSLRTSGALPAYAALHGAVKNNPGEFVAASLFGWLPANLLPEGELKQRELSQLYNMAREQYNAGDPEAINNFLDEHPEYEARLALYDEPEERLRQFLISEVWDRYMDLPSVDKRAAQDNLGEMFTQYFLNKETQNYDVLDNDTLAAWANVMGGETPNVPELAGVEDMDINAMIQAPPEESAAIDAYRQLRNQLFPNWYAVQSMYYEQPKGSAARKQVLREFPWLKDYWDWNRAQKAANPVIGKYAAPQEDEISVPYDYSFIKEFTPAMSRSLLGYYYANEPLSTGALTELRYLWSQYGQPGGDFDTFVEKVVPLALAP